MLKWVAICLSILVLAGTAAAGPVTVEEFLDMYSQSGHFELTNDSTDLFVAGFAVGHDFASFPGTSRPGWSSIALSEFVWDAGFLFTPNAGNPPLNTRNFGSFADFFGEDHSRALLYYANALIPNGPNFVRPSGFDDRFTFFAGELASPYIVILNSGGVLGPFDTQGIPEPGSLALVGLGLAGLGLVVRRRRRRAA